MKLAIALMLVATPALAMQNPSAGKNKDSHVCDVPYDPNDIVQITAGAGDAVTVLFGQGEAVAYVSVSDSAHLRFTPAGEAGNALYLKATQAMPPQPVSVRTLKDGIARDYTIQWTSIEPPVDPPRPSRVAANGDVAITEIAPPASATPCYIIRYTYAGQVDAAKAAQWRATAARRKQEQEEIALRQATDIARCDTTPDKAPPECNYSYRGMGDSSLAPARPSPDRPAVFDDGRTTMMHFPGNMSLPIVLIVNRDGKEAQPAGLTVEDGGVVKLHSVEPLIRLRDGDKVLCLVNDHYNQVGQNPGTGTTTPEIAREVKAKR